MAFLNSIALWGELAALGVAVPILIHLFNRLRYRRVDWAAMDFLRRAMVVRSRRIKLEDALLMALRCLALGLIGLALARPTYTGSGASWLAGREAGALIAVDGSFSMGHGGNFTRLQRARQRVSEVAGTLHPGQPVTLVVMGTRPRILLRNAGYEKERFEKVLEEETRVYPERLRLEPNLEELETLAREIRAASRECYLITDAQARTWEELSDKARASLASLGELARLFVVSTAPDPGENLALTRLDLAGGALRKGATAVFEAEVRNFGARPVQSMTVRLSANGKAVDQRIIERLEPGRRQAVLLSLTCQEAGDVQLAASFGSDALPLDNERRLVAAVRETFRVLVVDGRLSPVPFKSATDYLLTALQPRRSGAWASLDVRRVSPRELPVQALEEADAVCLADVPELPAGQAQKLRAFVEKGGGLVIFLGAQVQAALFNRSCIEEQGALTPVELLETAGSASEIGRAHV